jgi:hypothetical protein
MTGTVLVTGPFTETQRRQAAEAAPGWRLMFAERISDIGEAIAEVEVIAGTIGPDELARAPRLRWLHSWFAGQDSMLFPAPSKARRAHIICGQRRDPAGRTCDAAHAQPPGSALA